MILEKALTLELTHFEDSEFYDKLTRARREASSRPLSLVMRTSGLFQNAIAITSFAVLLAGFSPWAVVVLIFGGLPAFFAETKFSGDAFRLFKWRAPETRMQSYLETALAREDHAKEVKLFDLGKLFLGRYKAIYDGLYAKDRNLTVRRETWGFAFTLVSIAALYSAYAWCAVEAVRGLITLGEMTMYIMLFRQGQAAVTASLGAIGGMYEDNLYLSTLYEYLEQPVEESGGTAVSGPDPDRRRAVRRRRVPLPGLGQGRDHRRQPADQARREPGAGRRERLGQDHADQAADAPVQTHAWPRAARRPRPAGMGHHRAAPARRRHLPGLRALPAHGGRKRRRRRRARLRRRGALEARRRNSGKAAPFIDDMPLKYQTQLGKWFKDGRELSGGQWQKIALSRAFMRNDADILVLDEPTAAMDAAAEAEVFEHFRSLMGNRIAIVISHRFSTVRMADQIVVLDQGHIVERGNHESLMKEDGIYAKLFTLQARGYR